MRELSLHHYLDEPKTSGEEIYGIPVSKDIQPRYRYFSVIGDTRNKRKKVQWVTDLLPDAQWVNLIHYDTWIPDSVKFGKGVVVQPFTNIYSRVEIGNHVLICGGTRIGHDTKVGDYCTLCPEVAIAGGVTLGEGVFVGINSTIKDGIKVGKGAIIGAGAVVVNDVPERWIVGGNPARHIKGAEHW